MRRSSLGWPSSQAASCWAGVRCGAPCPGGVRRRGGGRRLGDAFDGADEGHEVGLPHDLEVAFRRARIAASSSAASVAPRPGWRSVRACRTSFGIIVMHEGGAGELRRQVDARHAAADHLIGRGRLYRCRAGGVLGEVDLAGHGPVVLPGRGAVLQEPAVVHGKVVGTAVQPQRRALQRPGPHLGADQPHRAARNLDRQRRGRVLLVGSVGGAARQDGDAVERQIELVGRDLADRASRTPCPISTLPVAMRTVLSGRKAIQRSSRGLSTRLAGSGGAFMTGSRCEGRAAARSTARRMRWWAPQRQRCRSSAATMSARTGRRIAVEQGLGRHHDAAQAVAALAGLLVEEGLLQRMRLGSRVPSPSTVVTARSATVPTSRVQA